MPEIAEVARCVHYLRKTLVGKTLSVVKAPDDINVFGKVGTSGAEFEKAMTGKKVLDAGQQGKYFWLIMSSPPHPVMHLGMTGWIKIRNEPLAHYRPKEEDESQEWPPRFWKFTVETEETPKEEAAFVDSRRFGRVRLVDCPGSEIRDHTPLKENGPDPVIDRKKLTLEWLDGKMKNKHVPIKALLLDQAQISGIGNWVGDEILYHAKIHPEQYSDTFSKEQTKTLHESILHITKTAVDALGDAELFPEDWIFKHRWGKGKKDAKTMLPNGEKIVFLTVGGRTSCVVPSVQKKTGPVFGDIDEKGESKLTKKSNPGPKKRKGVDEDEDEEEEPASKAKPKKMKPTNAVPGVRKAPKVKQEAEALSKGRRRSGRVSNGKD